MASLHDILLRTAANIGMQVHELEPYAQAMLRLLGEVRDREEDIDLMTFGKLRFQEGKETFHPHASLVQPDAGEQV